MFRSHIFIRAIWLQIRIRNAALNCFPALPNNFLEAKNGPLRKYLFHCPERWIQMKTLENKKIEPRYIFIPDPDFYPYHKFENYFIFNM